MIKAYEKLQNKEWQIINKAFEKSDIAGYAAAAGIGLLEGVAIVCAELAVFETAIKVVSLVKRRR